MIRFLGYHVYWGRKGGEFGRTYNFGDEEWFNVGSDELVEKRKPVKLIKKYKPEYAYSAIIEEVYAEEYDGLPPEMKRKFIGEFFFDKMS